MYDSVTASDIPSAAACVAGYINGLYAWSDADWARFPNARQVRISVDPVKDEGDVLDVEPGDAGVNDAAGWIQMRLNAGHPFPVIYCSESNVATIQSLCAGLTYGIWSAHYTGTPYITPGCVATQYSNAAQSAGHYDLSLCIDEWPPASSQPTQPAPTPIDQGWLDKKDLVVNLTGEISQLANELISEANRKGGPRKTVIVTKANAILSRTGQILA